MLGHKVLVLFTLICIELAVPISGYNGHGWWLQQPYSEDDDFNMNQEYLSSFKIPCSSNGMSAVENITVDYWLIPDMSMINDMDPERTYSSFDGTSVTQWIDDGKNLNISILLENQFGFYFCHGKADGEKFVIKRAVNYKGPYFGDTWEMYRMNTIIGCSSSAIFLLIATVFYCIYEYKYNDDDLYVADPPRTEHTNGSYSRGGHANAGYAAYENAEITKRHLIDIDTTEL